MIRALHLGLGIPTDVLLQEPQKTVADRCNDIEWQKFPLQEMIRRGWIRAKSHSIHDHAEELLKNFFSSIGGNSEPAICRRAIHKRSIYDMDSHALLAWTARVLIRAKQERGQIQYRHGTVTRDFMREVARLTWFERGPSLAKEFLAKSGITLIFESALPRTMLDGGAMLTEEGWPVIGMTLRYDRLDNFWYTLMHELSHVSKHLKSAQDTFIDDLDSETSDDLIEKEADKMTRDSFIPRSLWMRSDAFHKQTPEAVLELAKELRIHPAIIAGRIRHETKNYRLLNDLIGQGQVHKAIRNL
jgi:HTH-type transcriptional regulator/antitoxin HigA